MNQSEKHRTQWDTVWIHFLSYVRKKLNRAAFSNEVRKDTTERQWKVRGTEKANRTSTIEQESTSYIESDTSSTNKGSIFILHTGNNSKIWRSTHDWVQRVWLATSQGRNAHCGLLSTVHGCNLQLQVSSLWSSWRIYPCLNTLFLILSLSLYCWPLGEAKRTADSQSDVWLFPETKDTFHFNSIIFRHANKRSCLITS